MTTRPKTRLTKIEFLIMIMIIASFVVFIGPAMQLATAIQQHGEVEVFQAGATDCLRAECLAVQGLERAWVKLQTSTQYQGESWSIPNAGPGGRNDAVVVITVSLVPGHNHRLWVQAQANYQLSATFTSHVTKNLMMDRIPTAKPEKTS